MHITQSVLAFFFVTTCLCGCSQPQQDRCETGFLTDYSRLQCSTTDTCEYIGSDIPAYSRFIVEPVVVYFHPQAMPKYTYWSDLKRLTHYMRSAFVNALSDQYTVVSAPGPGIARIRMAITDIRKSDPGLVGIYATRFAGVGVGGAAMEAEILVSMTGTQLAAIIQNTSAKGSTPAPETEWSDTKAVMDEWARRFRFTLDKARQNTTVKAQISNNKGAWP